MKDFNSILIQGKVKDILPIESNKKNYIEFVIENKNTIKQEGVIKRIKSNFLIIYSPKTERGINKIELIKKGTKVHIIGKLIQEYQDFIYIATNEIIIIKET